MYDDNLFDNVFPNIVYLPVILFIIGVIIIIAITIIAIVLVKKTSKQRKSSTTKDESVINNFMDMADSFNNVKCEYCGSKFNRKLNKCPNCGARKK